MKSMPAIFILATCLLWITRPTVMAFRFAIRRWSRHHYPSFLSTTTITPQQRQPQPCFLSSSNNFEKEFQQKQAALSNSMQETKTSKSTSQKEHTQHQTQVFDEMASFFASEQAIPPEVVPVLDKMADTMVEQMIQQRRKGAALNRPARVNATYIDNVYHILDVGCGAGALFEAYVKAANEKGVTIHIQGLDLAPKMVEQANHYATQLLSKSNNSRHSISVQVGDVCEYTPKEGEQQQYDLVVANACFGNIWDPALAVQKMADALRLDGVLCITHPLGSQFVKQLHQEDPKTVPRELPTQAEFEHLARTLPLLVEQVLDKDETELVSFYKATAIKTVHRTLPETMRLRGTVDSGYGRGGKKLGFPTANLPSGLFQGALQDVACGVYFGWAVLEGDTKGRNIPHKAVVNVGYSPTFEGQENPEKIVEAHLMFDKDKESPLDPPDFYGEVMRLQLIGFIRPEMKFPSFPALIAQISTDVEDAKDALDLQFYQDYRQDPFVSKFDAAWIGTGGGDETASWEFDDVEAVLKSL